MTMTTQDAAGPSRRSLLRAAGWTGAVGALAAQTGLLSGCAPTEAGATEPGSGASPSGGQSTTGVTVPRAPQPTHKNGLQVLAEQDGRRLLLHTTGGDIDFWSGVNLGSTLPGHNPGEMAIDAATYRRWLPMMRDMGVRFLRIYTIHPPSFYAELHAFNSAHPEDPIYLVQGIYLPDESYLQHHDLYAAASTRAMIAEVKDAVAAVHGTLTRAPRRGRASGAWRADVSTWLAAWLVGVEWDPIATAASDAANAHRPRHIGRYFTATSNATPTENWVCARMDELATLEAGHGRSLPIALVNWPTADPLHHPTEPLDTEDMISVDANHVLPTSAWPGGTFASYHAYPYYPDFQRLQPSYEGPDRYRAYLLDLARHHAGMPTLITELGVPGALGSAHYGTNGRDQGHHSEQEEMAMDAALVQLVHDARLGGAMLFAWVDEWFKFTWNTLPRQGVADSERRSLWHDPLTNEQYFGLLAVDPQRAGSRVVHEARDGVRTITLDHDASWVYLTAEVDAPLAGELTFGFDVVPGAGLRLPGGAAAASSGGDDIAVVLRGDAASAYVRGTIDPILLDGLPATAVPAPGADGWSLQRLTLNRPYPAKGALPARDAELLDIGTLVRGSWEVGSERYDSMATWSVDAGADAATKVVRLRLPWSMLALGDPSSRTAVVPVKGVAHGVAVERISATLVTEAGATPFRITWEGWNQARYSERLKAGSDEVKTVLRRLGA